MKIIDYALGKIGYTKAASGKAVEDLISSMYTGQGAWGVAPVKPYQKLIEGYQSWVYTTIDKIAKTVAMTPLKLFVYRKQGKKIKVNKGIRMELADIKGRRNKKEYLKAMGLEKEEIFNHPFLELCNKPNNNETRMAFWYSIMVKMELTGKCFIYLPSNSLGLPQEMWALPLTKYGEVRPVADKKILIRGYKYVDGDVRVDFLPEEILFIKYPNPASPFDGMSPLMAQTYPYDIDLYLGQQQYALFKNMGIPGLTLSTDQPLGKEQVDQLKKYLTENYGNAIKSGMPLVLHSGLKGDNSLAQNAREFRLADIAKYVRDKLITAYDVPAAKIMGETVNRATMEVLDETFLRECIRPKVMLIEEMFEAFVLPRYDDNLTCDFDLPEVKDRDMDLKERESNLKNYYTTINEEREHQGKAPVDWGNEPWMPIMLIQPGATPKEPEPDKQYKSLMDFEEKKVAIWKDFIAKVEAHEKPLIKLMQGIFKEQLKEVLGKLESGGKAIEGTFAGWGRKKIEQVIKEKDITARFNIDKAKEIKKLKEKATPIITNIFMLGGQNRLDELDEQFGKAYKAAEIVFDVNDPEAVKWLGARLDKFSKKVTGTTFDKIKAKLREGFAEGEPSSVIGDELRLTFASFEQYRAPLIARTEGIAALNKADLLGVKQAGMEDDLMKHWNSAKANTRDSHLAAEDRYAAKGIAIDEMFEVGEDTMDAPGNGNLAEENVNCACNLIYSRKKKGK